MDKKNNTRIILFYVVLIIGFIALCGFLLNGLADERDMKYSEIVDLFQNEQVDSFTVTKDNKLDIIKKDKSEVIYTLRSLEMFRDDLGDLIIEQHKAGIIKEYHYENLTEIPWWVSFIPYIIIIIAFIFIYFFMMNQAMGGKGGKINSFGRARAKMGSDEKKKVLFKDVAGADEEKEELREVVDFLKAPRKYTELGARIPKGVLLVGPPGTGKTLLAKAVAGEADVPFFSISGSDFVEMYVGVGASRVRDLFDTAKKASPAIIFIDEIDAVGRHRGAGLGGGHDEREQTLNQLLVEMDGFGNNDGVIVMAATNRPDILDPALLRPGRFDRQVTVNYPDVKGREEILKVHASGKHLAANVNLRTVAQSTAGFTGADLENLLNEAALLSARKSKTTIGMEEIEEATIKVVVGPAKKSKVISDDDKHITAIHEAGHAVASFFTKHHDPVHLISIIPAGMAAGFTLNVPKEDKMHMSRSAMEDKIVLLLGGRVAEAVLLEDICTGASNDIQRATDLARDMVTKYGMSDKLGPVVYGSGTNEVFLGRDFSSTPNYSEEVAATIDSEIRRIIEEAYAKATEIISAHKDKVEFIAGFLVRHESMTEEQFNAVMDGETDDDTLLAIEAERRKTVYEGDGSQKFTVTKKTSSGENGRSASDESEASDASNASEASETSEASGSENPGNSDKNPENKEN